MDAGSTVGRAYAGLVSRATYVRYCHR